MTVDYGKIENFNEIKYLGVILHSKLPFTANFKYVLKKGFKKKLIFIEKWEIIKR